MKKNIYKDVPEHFHRQLCETLKNLEEEKRTRYSPRRLIVILAAAVLAFASLTVAAGKLFLWDDRVSERFGTVRELEDKLTAVGAAKEEDAEVTKEGLTISAVQSLRTDGYYYFLLHMTLPEGLQWNEDMLFEECKVLSGQQFEGCVANLEKDDTDENSAFVEIQLLTREETDYAGEAVTLQLKNLVQTLKTQAADVLVPGEWEIPLSLPQSADTFVCLYNTEKESESLLLGNHKIPVYRIEISPFEIRIFTEKEAAAHALGWKSCWFTGVKDKEGKMQKEQEGSFATAGISMEEEFCFLFHLDTAVEPTQVAALCFLDEGSEVAVSMEGLQEISREQGKKKGMGTWEKQASVKDFELLYVSNDNAVLKDGEAVYLWDGICGGVKKLFDLKEYLYSQAKGGEITMGPGGNLLILLPDAESEVIYICDVIEGNVSEASREKFWPWSNAGSYKESLAAVTDIFPQADENYSAGAVKSGGSWYALYSEDGSAEKMKLMKR